MKNGVLNGCIRKFCKVYVDDIIVYYRTRDEHAFHLSEVFKTISQARVKINNKKSDFCSRKVLFVGNVFDGGENSTKSESVQCISILVKRSDLRSLQEFIGFARHFRAFI